MPRLAARRRKSDTGNMGREIERKFLVKGTAWRALGKGVPYRQGYLSTIKERTVRVRTIGDQGYVTVKGANRGLVRAEFEYEIPFADAQAMLADICQRPLIEKVRYRIPYGRHIWEVDEFHGENAGLVVAEVELSAEDQEFEAPDWVGEEVSHDPRYFNANLVAHPYKDWA